MIPQATACLLAVLLTVSLAWAQAESAPAPLSGPDVTEDRIDGVEAGFSAMTPPGRMTEPVPMPVFRRAVAELADEAPEAARLTGEQRQRLRAIEREHAQAIAAFRRQHADQFRELREALGPQLADRIDPQPQQARRGDGREGAEGDRPARRQPQRRRAEPGDRAPDQMDPEPPPMQPAEQRPLTREDLTDGQRAAIARLRELRSQAPGSEALQTKVWAELSEAQQAQVQARIDEHRARVAEQRQEAYVERMAARRRDAGPAPDAPEGDRPAARRAAQVVAQLPAELRETLESLPAPMRERVVQLPPERLEQVLARLSRLSPEERAQALRRLQREGQGDRPARGPRRGTDQPDRQAPPPIDRVRVPDPDR